MIGELIHRPAVERYSVEANNKVKLMERVHDHNILIYQKMKTFLSPKGSVTYKGKPIKKATIQTLANGTIMTAGGVAFSILLWENLGPMIF